MAANIDEPHFNVRYCLDNVRDTVPISWFKTKPKDYRIFDKAKQYLVFHSPGNLSTPESISEKNAIPVFETAEDLDKYEGADASGYYRATVCCSGATRAAVEEELKKRRISVVPQRLVSASSFEETRMASKREKPSGSKATNSGKSAGLFSVSKAITKAKKRSPTKEQSKRPISANIHLLKKKLSALDARESSLSRNPVKDTSSSLVQACPSSTSLVVKETVVSSSPSVLKAGKSTSMAPVQTISVCPVEAGTSNRDHARNVEHRNQATLNERQKKKRYEESDGTSSDEVDDCFVSIRDHNELMEKLKAQEAKIFALQAVNTRLRSAASEEIETVPASVHLEDDKDGPKSDDTEITDTNDNVNNAIEEEQRNYETIDNGAIIDTEKGRSTPDGNVAEEDNKSSEFSSEKYEDVFNRLGITITEENLKELTKFKAGQTGDKRFVKICALFMWGRSHLIRHSTGGRRDPKKKDAIPRPALDEERMKAVRELLIIRVLKEGRRGDTYGPRCELSKVKRYVGEKIQSLMDSEARQLLFAQNRDNK